MLRVVLSCEWCSHRPAATVSRSVGSKPKRQVVAFPHCPCGVAAVLYCEALHPCFADRSIAPPYNEEENGGRVDADAPAPPC